MRANGWQDGRDLQVGQKWCYLARCGKGPATSERYDFGHKRKPFPSRKILKLRSLNCVHQTIAMVLLHIIAKDEKVTPRIQDHHRHSVHGDRTVVLSIDTLNTISWTYLMQYDLRVSST